MLEFTKKSGETRFSRKLDCLFWWIVRLLPIFVMFVFMWKAYFSGYDENLLWGENLYYPFEPLSSILTEHFGMNIDNDITNALFTVFDSFVGGFYDTPFIAYFSYLVYVEIIHLFVDILLFIPRLAHKWMNGFIQHD